MSDLTKEFLETVPEGYKVVKEGEAYKAPDGHKLVKSEDFERLAAAGREIKKFKDSLGDQNVDELLAKAKGYDELKAKNVDDLGKQLEKANAKLEKLEGASAEKDKLLKETNLKNILYNRRLSEGKYQRVADEFIRLDDLFVLDPSESPDTLKPKIDQVLENALNRQTEVFGKVSGQPANQAPFQVGANPNLNRTGGKTIQDFEKEMTDEIHRGFGARGILQRMAKEKKVREE